MNLTFNKLSVANAERNNEVFPECNNWELTDWACCMAGEAGEACNIAKKIKLGKFPCSGTAQQPIFESKEQAIQALALEIAGTVIYADLLASACQVNLGVAIEECYNEVSVRKKSKFRL